MNAKPRFSNFLHGNKKAKVFSLFVVLLGIVAITQVFVSFSVKQRQFNTIVGEESVGLLGAYQTGEMALFYVDQAAKYSVDKSAQEISQKGMNARCLFDDCPDKQAVRQAFSASAQKNLDAYLSKYTSVSIPLDNYDFSFKAGEVIGIANNNIMIEKGNAKYSVKPSFRVILFSTI